ncbi:hypothetical protein RUM43_014086 [Polyplax serrata]|uniref:Enkurin domain-containing protein n=1 Tax=Polyplax serrata TaxID=468196 RepID=A0AAN8P1Q5_POLSC
MSPTVKSPRYKSKRKSIVKMSDKKAKAKYNGHQTFGLAHYEAPQSWNYLKKGQPKKYLDVPATKIDKREFKCTVNCKSSPVPKCSVENPKRIDKNYIKENIKKIAAIQPKEPCPRRVDTPRGTVKDLAHLLQMIKIRQSEEYGRIPEYLCKRRKQWAKERKMKEQQQLAVDEYKRKMGIGTMGMNENVYMIDQETRQKLLDGLKENWNELSKQFLKLPVMSDTLPKIKRKMWLEQEIDQLEKDVKLVESHPYIYLERQDLRPYEEIVADELKREATEKKKKIKEKENQERQITQVEDEQQEQQSEDKKEEDVELKILNY